MRRRPIAAIVPSAAATERVEDGLHALSVARPFELEVIQPLDLLSSGSVPWPGARPVRVLPGLRRVAILRVASRWLVQPRARRPEVVLGLGAGAELASALARVLGARGVAWLGLDAQRLEPPEDAATSIDALWVGDPEAERVAARRGLRAELVPFGPRLEPASAGGHGEGLVVLLPRRGRLAAAEREALERIGAGVRLTAIGDEPAGVAERFVVRTDRAARLDLLRSAVGVVAPAPDTARAELVEALGFGRPIVVPEEARPPFFDSRVGVGYGRGRPESLGDAMAEVLAAPGRGRFDPAHLRAVAEAEAREATAVPERLLTALLSPRVF